MNKINKYVKIKMIKGLIIKMHSCKWNYTLTLLITIIYLSHSHSHYDTSFCNMKRGRNNELACFICEISRDTTTRATRLNI